MEEMNYIRHLNAVFTQFSKDGRLNPTHISLYIALFQLWNMYHFPQLFYINRQEVMALSKIGSKSTYHRCIKALSDWQYVLYEPSKNKFKGSQIMMFQFGTSTGQEVDSNGTKSGTSTGLEVDAISTKSGTSSGQEVVSKIKHIQTIKNKTNEIKQADLIFKNFSGGNKRQGSVPYQDNLQVRSDKNYHEPL